MVRLKQLHHASRHPIDTGQGESLVDSNRYRGARHLLDMTVRLLESLSTRHHVQRGLIEAEWEKPLLLPIFPC